MVAQGFMGGKSGVSDLPNAQCWGGNAAKTRNSPDFVNGGGRKLGLVHFYLLHRL